MVLELGFQESGSAGSNRHGQDLRDGQPCTGDASARRLVMAHNKTLAAQLYAEFKRLFPEQRHRVFRQLLRLLSAGSLCASARLVYREKSTDINEQIERLRLSATASLVLAAGRA